MAMLPGLGPRAQDAVPDLLEIARNAGEDESLRQEAIAVIGVLAPDGNGTIAPLLALVDRIDERPMVWYAAARALAEIGTPVVSTFVERLSSHRGDDASRAEQVLMMMPASASLPSIVAALKDPRKRTAALRILGAVGAQEQRPAEWAVQVYLEDSDPDTRREAEWALTRMRERGAPGSTASR
jgi:HEAT repeat protein